MGWKLRFKIETEKEPWLLQSIRPNGSKVRNQMKCYISEHGIVFIYTWADGLSLLSACLFRCRFNKNVWQFHWKKSIKFDSNFDRQNFTSPVEPHTNFNENLSQLFISGLKNHHFCLYPSTFVRLEAQKDVYMQRSKFSHVCSCFSERNLSWKLTAEKSYRFAPYTHSRPWRDRYREITIRSSDPVAPGDRGARH